MELASENNEKAPRFTKHQIKTIAVRVGVVVVAIGTIAYISHKMKTQNDES